jgi:hypothetical protein
MKNLSQHLEIRVIRRDEQSLRLGNWNRLLTSVITGFFLAYFYLTEQKEPLK